MDASLLYRPRTRCNSKIMVRENGKESNDWIMEVECCGRQSYCITHVLGQSEKTDQLYSGEYSESCPERGAAATLQQTCRQDWQNKFIQCLFVCNIEIRIYHLKAVDFHLPIDWIWVSVILISAAVVAAPIRKLCALYLVGSNPAHFKGTPKFQKKLRQGVYWTICVTGLRNS